MEGLLSPLLDLFGSWDKVFSRKKVARRATALAVSMYLTLGRKTISRALCAAALDQFDWTAMYRIFSRRVWAPRSLFTPIIEKVSLLLEGDESPITVAFDDTVVRKTGRHIVGTAWQRDPLSPHFRVNFVWGIRYLQASLLVPLYRRDPHTPPRGLPIRIEQLPKFKKPSKKSSSADWARYRKLTKKFNLSTAFARELRFLRNAIDQQGLADREVLAVGDNHFCNRHCFLAGVPKTNLLVRAKRNARLYQRAAQGGGRRFYEPHGFTPEDVHKNESKPFSATSVFYGGTFREVRYKEIPECYWKKVTSRLPLRLIVVAPTPYRRDRAGHLVYNDPAFLLTNDVKSPVATMIQKYFDRWQIEVNFRDEKDLMGLAQQQVWSPRSVPRLPAFIAASYSVLLLASILRFKDRRDPLHFPERPRWRRDDIPTRPSCLDLLALIRAEIIDSPQVVAHLGIAPGTKSIVAKAAA